MTQIKMPINVLEGVLKNSILYLRWGLFKATKPLEGMVPTSTPKNQKMRIPGPGSKVSTQFAVGVRFSSLNTVPAGLPTCLLPFPYPSHTFPHLPTTLPYPFHNLPSLIALFESFYKAWMHKVHGQTDRQTDRRRSNFPSSWAPVRAKNYAARLL